MLVTSPAPQAIVTDIDDFIEFVKSIFRDNK